MWCQRTLRCRPCYDLVMMPAHQVPSLHMMPACAKGAVPAQGRDNRNFPGSAITPPTRRATLAHQRRHFAYKELAPCFPALKPAGGSDQNGRMIRAVLICVVDAGHVVAPAAVERAFEGCPRADRPPDGVERRLRPHPDVREDCGRRELRPGPSLVHPSS
eukprot:gene4029-biopygen14403